MDALSRFNMELSEEEQAILTGDKGDTLRKAMEAVILYGATFGAIFYKIT